MKKFILIISVVCILVGNFMLFYNNMFNRSNSLKTEVSTFLSELSEGLSIKNSELFIDKSILSKNEYVIGNTKTVFVIDESKSFIKDGFDKSELFKLRSSYIDADYIIYIGVDGIHFNDKLGYGEVLFYNISSKSNIISGNEFMKSLNINEYLFLNIPSLILEFCSMFFGFLIIISLQLIMFYVFCFYFIRK